MEKLHLIRYVSVIMVCAALVGAPGTVALALPSYVGTLSTETLPPGILGTGVWIDPGPTQIAWSVAQLADGSWDYIYAFDVPRGDVSHFLLEVSPDFTVDDMRNVSGSFTSFSVGTFTPPDPSNPGLPGTIHAIKFETVDTTSADFIFNSPRAPVWGDFYAKDGDAGNPQGVTNAAWDAGFTLADPPDPPTDGSFENKILVPDTVVPVPDASTVMLACFGALPMLAAARKRIFR